VKWKRLIGKITSRYGGILFPVPSSFWFAWKRREPGILPDPKDGEEEIVRCGGASERERRRVSGREVGFGLTQRLFRAPWRWSGLNSWSPQRRWGRPYRPQINYHLSGTGNQSPFYGNTWRSQRILTLRYGWTDHGGLVTIPQRGIAVAANTR